MGLPGRFEDPGRVSGHCPSTTAGPQSRWRRGSWFLGGESFGRWAPKQHLGRDSLEIDRQNMAEHDPKTLHVLLGSLNSSEHYSKVWCMPPALRDHETLHLIDCDGSTPVPKADQLDSV